MARLPEKQLRINTQFAEETANLKTKMLFVSQTLGALIKSVDGIFDVLVMRGILSEQDPLLQDYHMAISEVEKSGFKMEPPTDPEAVVYQVKCPNCQAVIKADRDAPPERCDWCGHVFQG